MNMCHNNNVCLGTPYLQLGGAISIYCPFSYMFWCKSFLAVPTISDESWIFSRNTRNKTSLCALMLSFRQQLRIIEIKISLCLLMHSIRQHAVVIEMKYPSVYWYSPSVNSYNRKSLYVFWSSPSYHTYNRNKVSTCLLILSIRKQL